MPKAGQKAVLGNLIEANYIAVRGRLAAFDKMELDYRKMRLSAPRTRDFDLFREFFALRDAEGRLF